MLKYKLTSSKRVRSKSLHGTWSKHICSPNSILKFLSHLWTADQAVRKEAVNVCFRLKYPSGEVIFRFLLSLIYLSWLTNGGSVVCFSSFHPNRRNLRTWRWWDFSFWKRKSLTKRNYNNLPNDLRQSPNLFLVYLHPISVTSSTFSATAESRSSGDINLHWKLLRLWAKKLQDVKNVGRKFNQSSSPNLRWGD